MKIENLTDEELKHHSDYCAFNSYKGWLKPCDHYRLYQKYGKPLEKAVDSYYVNHIQTKKGLIDHDESRNGSGGGIPESCCG